MEIATSKEDQDAKPTGTGSPGAGEGTEGTDKGTETQKDETPEDPKAALERAQAEKEEALRIARQALRETESAKAYVATLTSTIKDSAEKIAVARERRTEGYEEPSLAERLQEDPEAVLEEHYNRRTAPIIRANLETQARQSRELAVMKLKNQPLYEGGPSLWDRYGEECDQFLSQFPAESRASPDAYDAAVGWVRSKHIDEEVAEREKVRREAEKRSFVESPTAGPQGGQRKKAALSDVERAVAKGLNLTEEEFLQYKEG